MVIALVIINIITTVLLCATAIALVRTTDREKKRSHLRDCVLSYGDKHTIIRLTKQESNGVKAAVSAFNFENDGSELKFQELKIIK